MKPWSQELDLTSSQDLLCVNLLCDKVGDPCICRISRRATSHRCARGPSITLSALSASLSLSWRPALARLVYPATDYSSRLQFAMAVFAAGPLQGSPSADSQHKKLLPCLAAGFWSGCRVCSA